MADISYTPKFKEGQIVILRGTDEVAQVSGMRYDGGYPHDAWEMRYDLLLSGGRVLLKVSEPNLAPLSLWRYCWYRNPATGSRMIGANYAWPIFFAEAVALAASAVFLSLEGHWLGWVAPAIAVLIPCIVAVGTVRNFQSKQF